MARKKFWAERQKRCLFATALLFFCTGAVILSLGRGLNFAELPSGPVHNKFRDPNHAAFFFVETSGRHSLNGRQACAAESAALHHPNSTVHFFATGDLSSTYVDVLRNISNVKLLQVHPEDVFEDTPLKSWYASPVRVQSPYAVAHLSDALRLVILWRFGGVYLDTDVVVQRPMVGLANALGRQDERDLGNGVLVFDRGHPVLLDAMEYFPQRYRAHEWAFNGPLLLQTVIRHRCPDCLREDAVDSCGCDLHVLPRTAFYAVPYGDWRDMLDASKTADVLLKTRDSYLLHFWNYLSSETPVERGSLYDVAAKSNCPRVYEMSLGRF